MISANVVAASECIIDNPRSGRKATSRIVSMEVVMPRFILAEFNTHRMFSRNSASSRAIPFTKMAKSVQETPFRPIAWQLDHKGMQATEYLDENLWPYATAEWYDASKESIKRATSLNSNGVSKQIANRLLEPFMWHKVLVTSTEWDNFFELRCPQYEMKLTQDTMESLNYYKSKQEYLEVYNHLKKENRNKGVVIVGSDPNNWTDLQWLQINKGMSEIHMMALAEAMYIAYKTATFKQLNQGEYHIPYGDNIDDRELLKAMYEGQDIDPASVIGAELTAGRVAVAIARCARLSYQTLGDEPKIDYVADLDLYRRLVQSGHMSPSEHVARAMDEREYWSYGKTIMYDKRPKQLFGYLNNFQGFIQQRILIENIYE